MKKPPLFIRVQGRVITFYEFFGAPEDAADEDLKKIYRRLCFENHPDRNKNDAQHEAQFKRIQQVWEWLGKRRAEYDANLRMHRYPQTTMPITIRFTYGNAAQSYGETNSTASGGW